MIDDGNEQRRDLVFVFAETHRQRIAPVIEGADSIQHGIARLGTHALLPVQHAGDGTDPDTRTLCNVFDACHAYFTFFALWRFAITNPSSTAMSAASAQPTI